MDRRHSLLGLLVLAFAAPIQVAAQTGACCSPTGTCIETTREICEAGGRQYLGDGTTCDPNPCHTPFGACCFPDDTCQELEMAECAAAGGVFQGDSTACGAVECPPLGACCLFGDLCAIAEQSDCIFGDGEWQGVGTTCTPDPCTATSALGPDRAAERVTLRGPFPNPTAGVVHYRVELPASTPVRIRIVDVTGRVVGEPVHAPLPAGVYTMGWTPTTVDGRDLPNGIYFLHLQAAGTRTTRKIVLTR
jgi:hypothetical protein